MKQQRKYFNMIEMINNKESGINSTLLCDLQYLDYISNKHK
jgi:hypothetical protein